MVLQVTPKEIGELRITGLAYNLAGDSNGVVAVTGRQLLIARGPKLRPAKDKKPEDGPTYAIDNRLRLNVMESAPCLKVGNSIFRSIGSYKYYYIGMFLNFKYVIKIIYY